MEEEVLTEAECVAYIVRELGVSPGMALSMLRNAIRTGDLEALFIDEDGNAILVDPKTVKGVQ